MTEKPYPVTPTANFDLAAPIVPEQQLVPLMAPVQFPQPLAVGRIRGTGLCIFLSIITLGIYSLVWYYQVHDEMKRHTGQGLGGGLGLVIAFFVGIASPFIVSAEVGQLYQSRGQRAPVSGTTGLWYLLGAFILIGPIVWFVKTNGALNAYWRSVGVR